MTSRVALIDSGVNLLHPHVRGAGDVVPGPTIGEGGAIERDAPHEDVLGHGTAAAAAILDLAPGTTLYSIRVFTDRAECPFDRVVAALRLALAWKPRLVNLSLGTPDERWRDELLAVAAEAERLGISIVSPATHGSLPSLPGSLAGYVGVLMDARLPRERPERREIGGRSWWFASPYPRDLPNLPRSANLAGVSMAAANLTGWLARGGDQGDSTRSPSSSSS